MQLMSYRPFPPFRLLLASVSLTILLISGLLWVYAYIYEPTTLVKLQNDMFHHSLFSLGYIILTGNLVGFRYARQYTLRSAIRDVWSKNGFDLMLGDVAFLAIAGLVLLVTYMTLTLGVRNIVLTTGSTLLMLYVMFWFFRHTHSQQYKDNVHQTTEALEEQNHDSFTVTLK